MNVYILGNLKSYLGKSCFIYDKVLFLIGNNLRIFKKMKTLPHIKVTPEQLPLISSNSLGVEIICGAAGSGKTSTALLRLRSLCCMFAERYRRKGLNKSVKVLILTFNRTLTGYIKSLATHQIDQDLDISLEIDTFGGWALNNLPTIELEEKPNFIKGLAYNISELSHDYVLNEVSYVLSRFLPQDLENYITTERTGRGTLPRVDKHLRRKLLDSVIYPYLDHLNQIDKKDWNGVAVSMLQDIPSLEYDIVIVDESQDFSANQLRAIKHHLAVDHTVTFVIDTVQRIYARGFTWAEVGFEIRRENSHRLRENYRNTVEIAKFAAGILSNMPIDADGALPNLHAAARQGKKPRIIRGLYSQQVDWVIKYIRENVNLKEESVAFLQPLGGTWFNYIIEVLQKNKLDYVQLTRKKDWPCNDTNIALSTFHSAKGLEFDYVFILGLNNQNTLFDEEDKDDRVQVLRRLLAVAVARARNDVIIGYKLGEESKLTKFFDI
ncbi:3'-5' exonuclease [Acinetobacter baumannii]|uniref:DNA 3'-5' helicase n=4 Tax=Acinetobacter baumannii TaxID=470 RepID=A0A009IIU5_ACIB9|nr:3'-5' exonuclease [Acinetobacter baumannii]EXB03728.1 uvrD/REP helicase N-terminal domain protein [Acinetobacter baumannii 1295743]